MTEKRLRILCVNGSPAEGQRLRHALLPASSAFTVSIVGDRQQFEQQLSRGDWDLIVSDLNAAGFEDLEILDVVRNSDATLPVVIVTGSGSEEMAARAMRQGAADYLNMTSAQLHRLPEAVRAAVARRRGGLSISKLRAILETSIEGIVVVSNAGRVIYSNARSRELWNIPPSMLAHADFAALQAFAAGQLTDPEAFLEWSRNSLEAEGRSFDILTFKDGRVFERHAEPHLLDGRRIGRIISYRDITLAVQAEQQLKASLALQKATLESTADGILVVDHERKVVSANSKFQQLWRVPDDVMAAGDDLRLLRFVLDQLTDPDAFLQSVELLYAQAGKTGRDTLQFRDGRVFERFSQPQWVDGMPAGRVWSFRDVTAIKAVEEALRGSERRFRLMFEQTADALMILDGVSGRFIDCNQATVEMLRCADKQEILTLHPAQISPLRQPDGQLSADKANEMIGIAMREGSHRFEWTHCSAQREDFPAEVLLTPIVLEQQQLIIATVRDITERKRDEQMQHALHDISEAAQSTVTLTDLFHRIHQIIDGLLPARNFFVALYDENRDQISFPYYVDEFDADPEPMRLSDGTVTGRVIQRGEALLFTSDSLNDGSLQDMPYIGAGALDWLGVPLKSKERTIGALVVQSYDGSVRYTARDKTLLGFVCGQIATTIERKQAEAALRESEAQLEEAQRLAHLGSWIWNIDSHTIICSDELCRIFGVEPGHYVPRIRDFLGRVHPDDRGAIELLLSQAQTERKPLGMELRIFREDGEMRTLQSQTEVRLDEQGRVTGMVGTCLDISGRKRDELLERDRRLILEQVAKNEPLSGILARVVNMLETQIPGARCAILLLENGRLWLGSAPHLPETHVSALEGLAIGPAAGSAGTACYREQAVIVQDIASDPLWDGYREWAMPHGLRASWAMPIPASEGGVLGSFAVYHDKPCSPTLQELDFLTAASRLAALAIEHRRLTDRLSHQGQHDALTGLPNRLLLQDRLNQALALAMRKSHQVAVLFMDLDRFKQINDTLGHSHGDTLLRAVARRLEGCIRKSDTLARLGGDEFMVVVPELVDPQEAMRVAGKLMQTLRAPFQVDGHEFFVSVSLGISIYPADGEDGETLMANADAAMYRAKETGRDNCMWFTPQMNARMMERIELESQFRHAWALGQLSLHYQPQCGAVGEIQGFEALLRWQHPTLGMVPPARFIPLAEESGLIVPIGEWVLREACMQAASWRKAGHADLRISVNVSAIQFKRGNLLDTVRRVLADTRLEPAALVLEITESLLLQNAAEASTHLIELRRLGVGIAIDDFGTGYSSLSYLHKLPVTTLKIDRSFVCEIGVKPMDGRDEAPIIRTIIALARNLGLSVVAEGVETLAQWDLLLALGCDGFQGFLLHPPLTVEDAGLLLDRVAEPRG